MSGVSKWRRKDGLVPSKKSASNKKIETHQRDSAAEPKIKPSVIHIVREGSFVHCHLACGHMITMHPEDLKESSTSAIECWACEEESKKGFLSR